MVKLLELLTRKDGLTHEEFSRYWEETHGPLVASMVPGIKRYVQNHPVRLPGREPKFDGIAEIWFEDFQSWRKSADWYLSDESKALHEDEEKFVNRSKIVVFVAEETVFK
ncbi:EthD domain-containing protein [Chloroflexota bacterium]